MIVPLQIVLHNTVKLHQTNTRTSFKRTTHMSSFTPSKAETPSNQTPGGGKKQRTRQRRTPSKPMDAADKDTDTATPESNKDNGKVKKKGGRRDIRSKARTPSSTNSRGKGGTPGRAVYQDHVPLSFLPAYSPGRKVIYGRFRGTTTSRRSGYVTPTAPPEGMYVPPQSDIEGDVYIEGDKRRNRVMDGEYCYVSIDDPPGGDAVTDLTEEMEAMAGLGADERQEPRKAWKDMPEQMDLWSPQHNTLAPSPLPPPSSIPSKKAPRITGQVISVLPSPTPLTVVGVLKPNPNGKGGTVLCPMSNKMPVFYVPGR